MCGRYNLIHDPAVWRLTRPIKVGKTAPSNPGTTSRRGSRCPCSANTATDWSCWT